MDGGGACLAGKGKREAEGAGGGVRNRIMDSDMTRTISILREPGLPAAGVPEGFTPAWVGEALSDSCRGQVPNVVFTSGAVQ